MQKFPILLFVLLVSYATRAEYRKPRNATKLSDTSALNIIPLPFNAHQTTGSFYFNKQTALRFSENPDEQTLSVFRRCLKMMTSFDLPLRQEAASNDIRFITDPARVPEKEGYTLLVSSGHIIVTGHDAAGLFYGLQSLVQLAAASGNASVPGCFIEDHPRFSYRGMHLDVCRHFFSVESILKWIDVLALYKINTFHWHLTDDQGWRIEIKAFPKLQTISAYRNETLIGHKKELPHVFDGKRYGGFYTQEEVTRVVHYAAARHISIIPEIEMPGHAMAALAAYPNLGCTGGPYQTATFWGIFSDVYCAGNDSTFLFLQTVLDEVLTLFPSHYIHIGGDECPKQRWQACPKCRRRMADEKLTSENELQSYFIKRMEKYLNSKGRQIIGWDEILEGGLSPGATVMSWTGEQGGITAARENHPVIMTPEKMVYLDYYQSLYPGEPLAGGGYLPLDKIYGYEPLPSVLSAEQAKYIIGVQANVWTEYMESEQKAEYMMFPRMMALAELAWSPKDKRNYPDFLNRLRAQKDLFEKLNIHAANVYDEITYSAEKGAEGKTIFHLNTTLPGSEIRYTLSDKPYTIYKDGFTVNREETIRAAAFKNGLKQSRVFEKKILFHKAIGKKVQFTHAPMENFNPGDPSALVNGIEASDRYNDGQWFGFSGVNLEAVIDLDSVQEIHEIGTNILKYHWQKMWEPVELSFSVSTNGVDYTQVYTQKDFPVNGINTVRAKWPPAKARFIKVTGINKGTIPPGQYISGAKAILLVDEVWVY